MWREIREEWRSIDSDRSTLRKFGLLVGSVLWAIGIWQWWQAEFSVSFWSLVFSIPGVLLILFGTFAPAVLKPVNTIWMGIAVVLGFFMTRVILTLVFFIAVVPIGLILKLLRIDPLDRKLEPERTSYWKEKTYRDSTPKRLEKYF